MKNLKLNPSISPLNLSQRLYQLPVPIIGLTGGIATGKTTVSRWFQNKGCSIISADELVKQIYRLPQSIEWAKNHHLPINNDQIDFKKLRSDVFNNPELKETIENFIYSQLEAAFLKAYQHLPSCDFVIYDVPLLFEKKLMAFFDLIILVYAPRKTQIHRLTKRDHISTALAEKILNAQMDIESKRTQCQYVIDNSNDSIHLDQNTDLKQIYQKLFIELTV